MKSKINDRLGVGYNRHSGDCSGLQRENVVGQRFCGLRFWQAFGLFRRDESRQHHGSDSKHEGLFDNHPGELGV